MAIRTSLLTPPPTSLLPPPKTTTNHHHPFPPADPTQSLPPRSPMPPRPETEAEWYLVFYGMVPDWCHTIEPNRYPVIQTPPTQIPSVRGGIWKPDRHGQWWPVYPDDPPNILEKCAAGDLLVRRCRHRLAARKDPVKHPHPPKSHTAHLRQSTLTGSPAPRAPSRPLPPPRPLPPKTRSTSAPLFALPKKPEEPKKKKKTVTYFRH